MVNSKPVKSLIGILGRMVGLLCFGLILTLGSSTKVLASPPSHLISGYTGSTQPGQGQAQLQWIGDSTASFNVWQSYGDGNWVKLNSSPVPPGSPYANSTTQSTATFTTTVNNYWNYYFAVSTSDVTDLSTQATSANTSNISTLFPTGLSRTYLMGQTSTYQTMEQNEHEYYTDSTELCGDCHETHTANGPDLTRQQTITDSCMFCHDGSGSIYDELDGTVVGPDPNNPAGTKIYPTAAGPFGTITTSSQTWTNSSQTVTSEHDLGSPLYTAAGGNTTAISPPWNEQLSCGSCHQPHIKDLGYDPAQNTYTYSALNYRLLQTDLPDAQNVKVSAFAIMTSTQQTVRYLSGMNTFCGGCHTDYNTKGASQPENNPSGTYTQMYRHAVGVSPSSYKDASGNPLSTTLPLEGNNANPNNNQIMCLTCHFAHGTTVAGPEASSVPGSPSSTMLKRRDYMGVCEDCHKK